MVQYHAIHLLRSFVLLVWLLDHTLFSPVRTTSFRSHCRVLRLWCCQSVLSAIHRESKQGNTEQHSATHSYSPIPQAAELVLECIIQAKHGRAGRLCPVPGGVTIENCYLSLRMQKPNVRWEPQAMKPIGELEAERPISAGQTEGEKEERRNTDLDMIRTLKEGRTTRLAVQLLYMSGGLFVINYPATNDVQSSQAGSR